MLRKFQKNQKKMEPVKNKREIALLKRGGRLKSYQPSRYTLQIVWFFSILTQEQNHSFQKRFHTSCHFASRALVEQGTIFLNNSLCLINKGQQAMNT